MIMREIHDLSYLKSPISNGYWYLASPYTNPDKLIVSRRVNETHKSMAQLLASGIFVYSPIWAAHHAALDYKLATDHKFWWKFNLAFLKPSLGMLILTLPGWNASEGIQAEEKWCQENNRLSMLIDPKTISDYYVASLP